MTAPSGAELRLLRLWLFKPWPLSWVVDSLVEAGSGDPGTAAARTGLGRPSRGGSLGPGLGGHEETDDQDERCCHHGSRRQTPEAVSQRDRCPVRRLMKARLPCSGRRPDHAQPLASFPGYSL